MDQNSCGRKFGFIENTLKDLKLIVNEAVNKISELENYVSELKTECNESNGAKYTALDHEGGIAAPAAQGLIHVAQQGEITAGDQDDLGLSTVSLDIRYKTVNADFVKVWTDNIDKEKESEEKHLSDKTIKNITDINFDTDEKGNISSVSFMIPEGYTKVRPAADDNVKIFSSEWNLVGKVKSCTGFKRACVVITPKPRSVLPQTDSSSYSLSYIVNNSNYQKMKESVKHISDCQSEVAKVLTNRQSKSNLVNVNVDLIGVDMLNQSQEKAVRTAIKECVSLIVGPYGCGKTTVIGSIISNLTDAQNKPGNKVLAVAPSNEATNHLAMSLARAGHKVLRIVAKSYEGKIDKSMPISEHCLHMKINDRYQELETPAERTKRVEEECNKAINDANVILTTCAAAKMEMVKSMGKFSAIVMDEACQV